jgi:hypothetical protein
MIVSQRHESYRLVDKILRRYFLLGNPSFKHTIRRL